MDLKEGNQISGWKAEEPSGIGQIVLSISTTAWVRPERSRHLGQSGGFDFRAGLPDKFGVLNAKARWVVVLSVLEISGGQFQLWDDTL